MTYPAAAASGCKSAAAAATASTDKSRSRPEPRLKPRPRQGNQEAKRLDCSLNQLIVLVAAAVAFILISATPTPIECHNIKRTQYHEQGLHGPKSYKFGFTSGDHKNPQERHEVSDGRGHVKGWYSYLDGAGKHQVVHYEAHPKYGFKVYNHNEKKPHNNGKRHYNS